MNRCDLNMRLLYMNVKEDFILVHARLVLGHNLELIEEARFDTVGNYTPVMTGKVVFVLN